MATDIYFGAIASIAALPDGSVLIAQAPIPVTTPFRELGLIDAGGNYRILFTFDGFNGRPEANLGSHRIVPTLVRAAPDSSFYVFDRSSGMVPRVLPDGSVRHFLGIPPKPEMVTMNGKSSAFEVRYTTTPAADAEGNLYIGALGKLYKLSMEGDLTHIAGNGGETPTGGSSPLDAALGMKLNGRFEVLQVDAAGGLYWRVDGGIRKLAKDGKITDVVGKGVGDLPSDSIEGKPATSVTFGLITRWAVAGNGDVYFTYKVPITGLATAPVIWRVGAAGVVERVAGKVLLQAAAPDPAGLPALEAMLHFIDGMTVSPEGVVFFAARMRIYRIDPQGVIRLVSYAPIGTDFVDGMPTVSAPSNPRGIFARAADQLLVALSDGRPILANYTVDGTVQVWRDGRYGLLNTDGSFLKDDRFTLGQTFPVTLPDGGLAWIEVQRDRSIVRRSFPVPAGCTYTTSADEFSVSGGNSILSLTLTTGPECPWTLGASSNWLEILGSRYGKGAATISLRTVANSMPVERVATLRVAGKEVLVRQGASVRTDIFLVSPASATIPPGGGAVRINITASTGLPWQVGLPETPVGIEGPSAGFGSGSFVLHLGALPANVGERTTAILINDKTVTLRQTAALVPVPVTINSTLAGTKAVIDLVERPLPYVAQWTPGSYHLLQAQPFTKVTDSTLIQFENFGTADPKPEQIFLAPPAPLTLTAHFRRLHLFRSGMEKGSMSIPLRFSTSFLGVSVPPGIASPIAGHNGFARWYPEGSTIKIFAPDTFGSRFTTFSGTVATTDNPASILIDQPVDITAHYVADISARTMLLFGGMPYWWFYGNERVANPAQVTVEAFQGVSIPMLGRFVAYDSPIGTPEWLTFHETGTVAPFTLEVGVDAAKAASLKTTNSPNSTYQATVILYGAGGIDGSFTATANVRALPTSGQPWIAALTDAGGFRQSTSVRDLSELLTAPGMIVTVFGQRFGTQTLEASATPLPTTLGGVSVELQSGSSGQWMKAPLFFVSPEQINFQVPPEMTAGGYVVANFRVRTSATEVSEPWRATIARRAVSLFSADSSGGGAPAGFYVRVAPNGAQQRGDLYRCVAGVCTVPSTSFGGTANDLFLEIYGTGFRDPGLPDDLRAYIGGRAAEVVFAGPHGQFVGLDQVNIKVPRDIERGVPLDLYVWVRTPQERWVASNRLVVRFE